MLFVAGLVVALGGDDDNGTLATSDRDTTTSSKLDPVIVSTTTPETTTSTAKPARNTTTTVAVEAEDKEAHCASTAHADPEPAPEDWSTYWETKPNPNDPMALRICVDDITPAVGQLVTLTVTADDPDAHIGDGECDVFVTWDANRGSLCRDVVQPTNEPQPTPAEVHGHVEKTFTHTYSDSTDPIIDVSVWSGPADGKRYPYNSYANIELRLNVHAR